MTKDFINLPMGRLCTVEVHPHYQASLTFMSASQGNVSMMMNADDLDMYINMLTNARKSMKKVDDEHDEEPEEQ